jgi:chemotaxis protein CheC
VENDKQDYEDILGEISNIGSGNAVTSLSQMLGAELTLDVPSCQLVTRENLGQLFKDPASLYAGVSMRLEGGLQCMLALLLNKEFTSIVLKQVAGEEITDVQHLTEMQKSAVCEIGNIMCNSYITAFSKLMERGMDVSVPSMAVDTGAQVLESFLAQDTPPAGTLLFVHNTFYYRQQKLASYILFHPTAASLEEILAHLNQ